METGMFWTANAADGGLVDVAELLSLESGGAATDSGDFDMSASSILVRHEIYLLANLLIVRPQNISFTGVRGVVQNDICV